MIKHLSGRSNIQKYTRNIQIEKIEKILFLLELFCVHLIWLRFIIRFARLELPSTPHHLTTPLTIENFSNQNYLFYNLHQSHRSHQLHVDFFDVDTYFHCDVHVLQNF